jgi:hypothetical protein
MIWKDVLTKTQKEHLVNLVLQKIKILQDAAKKQGPLSTIELGSNYEPNSLKDRDTLYLKTDGTLEYSHSYRDGYTEEWSSTNNRVPNEQKIRELIADCKIDLEHVEKLIKSLEKIQ